MKLNKIGEVCLSANRLLSDFIGLLSSKNFATLATCCNDGSSLIKPNLNDPSYNLRTPNAHSFPLGIDLPYRPM